MPPSLSHRRVSRHVSRSATVRCRIALLLAVLLMTIVLLPVPVPAATLRGEVVRLDDGDSLVVVDRAGKRHNVRLGWIDAPEHDQPYGRQSKHHLATLVLRKKVIVVWKRQDRYGRLIGRLTVNGRDAGLAQLRAGMAWHYEAYADEQSARERTRYHNAQAKAKRERRGLWAQSNPVPPWEFRRMQVPRERARRY